MGFQAMKIQQFPDIDLPTITVTASLPGTAPAQMETEVARKIENSLATVQGLKHIYTKVQDGTATITAEFRLEKPTQEALDDVRDAVSRVRSDLPADLRDPVISKIDLAGAPILTYTVASSRMDDEALSWFVDNEVTKRCSRVRGVGARRPRRRRDARGARRARPGAPARAAAPPPPKSRASCAHVQQEALGRAHRSRRRRTIGAHDRHRADRGRTRRARSAARPTAGACASIRSPRSATPWPSSARRRCSTASRSSASRSHARRGAGEVDVADGVRAALDELKAAHPDITVTEAFNFVDPVDRKLRTARWCC